MRDVARDWTTPAAVRRRRHRRCLAVAAGLGVAALTALVAKTGFDWPASADPVPWEVQHAVAGQPCLVGRADVCDCWGNFIDSEHLWRVEVRPEVIPAVAAQCGVVELESAEKVPSAFWRQRPYWWQPPRAGQARYFASPGFRTDMRGPDGQYYLMAYDEAAGVLYVWHKNNF